MQSHRHYICGRDRGGLKRVPLRVLIWLMALWIGGSYLGGYVAPDVVLAADASRPAPTFTINAITLDSDNLLHIDFSAACDTNVLETSLRLTPGVWLNWYNHRFENNRLSLSGDFQPGQTYQVHLPAGTRCDNREYEPGRTQFRTPDLPAALRFAEEGSLIERDSRQLLRVEHVNVQELRVHSLRVPPLLAGPALRHLDARMTFEQLQRTLSDHARAYQAFVKQHVPLQVFDDPLVARQAIFVPEQVANRSTETPLPLSWRPHPEAGALEVLAITGLAGTQLASTSLNLFSITNLAITYKLSAHNLLVWVTALDSGAPLADVAILALDADAIVVPLGVTDARGILLVAAEEPHDHYDLDRRQVASAQPLLLSQLRGLVAATENDRALVQLVPAGNLRPAGVLQASPQNLPAEVLKGHLFTERGVYQPGDTVHFKATLRRFQQSRIGPPQDLQPRLTIVDARNETILDRTLALSAFGTCHGELLLEKYYPTGAYTINLYAPSEEEPLARHTFEVQEFHPPRHFTRIDFQTTTRTITDYVNRPQTMELLVGRISGVYHAGGPVKHGRLRWRAYYSGTDFAQSDYPEMFFGSHLAARQELLESGEALLDETGELEIVLPVGAAVAAGTRGIEVVATVLDIDGHAATSAAVFQRPPDYLIGCSRHAAQVGVNEPQLLQVMLLDADRQPVAAATLEAEVLQQEYTYTRKRNAAGNVYWDWQPVWRQQVTTRLEIENGRALFDFDFRFGGDYQVAFSFRDQDGHVTRTVTPYSVSGGYYYDEAETDTRDVARLAVAPDRDRVAPGERLRVYFNTPQHLSHVLVTVEQDRILHHEVITPGPGLNHIDLAIAAEYVPTAYISLLATTGRAAFPVYASEFDEYAPSLLTGTVAINVQPATRQLSLRIGDGWDTLRARPGQVLELTLAVRDQQGQGVLSEVAVAVVDERILAMSAYQTPVLDDLTRFVWPLGVFSGDLRQELWRQTAYRQVAPHQVTGGGGMPAGADLLTNHLRKDFRPVAYFNPALRTAPDGNARIQLTLPDTLTTYRVFAIACDTQDGFVSAQRALQSHKNFFIEPALPAFLNRGDHLVFPVSAVNQTNAGGTPQLTLASDGPLELTIAQSPSALEAQTRAHFRVKAEALHSGTAHLQFTGNFNDEADQVAVRLPVYSGFPLQHHRSFGTFTTQQELTLDLGELAAAPDPDLSEISARLTIAGSPLAPLAPALQYLLEYPYGCVEQTSSGVMALAGLRRLVAAGHLPDMTISRLDDFLQTGLARIYALQTASGGFAYWPNQRQPHAWGSLYALMALTQAQAAGLEVSASHKARGLDYLSAHLQTAATDQNMLTWQAHAVYLLAHHNKLPPARLGPILAAWPRYGREGALLILLAAHHQEALPAAELATLARRALKQPAQPAATEFYAPYREPAVALLAATTLLSREETISGNLAQELLAGLQESGRWTSTSDTGWALLALARYLGDQPFSTVPAHISVRQNDDSILLEGILTPPAALTLELDPAILRASPTLTIASSNPFAHTWMLHHSQPRTDLQNEGQDHGFAVTKRIENTSGREQITVGDIVKVIVDIHIARPGRYLVLDDPLPAGLLAINSAFATEEHIEGASGFDAARYWNASAGVWHLTPSHFEIRHNRVLVFANQFQRGAHQFVYYARAVCEGDFHLPPTRVERMYDAAVSGFSAVGRVKIAGN